MTKNNVHFSSKSQEWETPQDLFDELSKEFNFRFDVCATKENAKCELFWTKEEDALKRRWLIFGGWFWMNPPYGREIAKFIEKADSETRNNKAAIVALLPARTDTKWFHDHIYGKHEVRFLKGRLKFSNSKNSAPFPSMIVIFKS